MSQTGKAFEMIGRRIYGLGEMLLKDVRPEQFAHQPPASGGGVVKTNHPAFVYGHLSLYPARVLDVIGRDGSTVAPGERYTELFGAGKECMHDPDGRIYPPMEEIVAHFKRGHEAALAVIAEVDESVFAKETPNEAMRARFPTVGALTGFLLCSHTAMHLGQMSAWRRCMGLGSVM